ncbi:hypothetical protein Q4512_05695 [Oceanihabitans sp. 2_MG-2023]|uniref:leucine-rich repeat domain-containing protein n=1 Tax=Oceanihabitans sp. 2_MG-2023 TaxID=3062661 RepID=UPI0026E1177C|nr:hypothetical protein [Oceanihabitans sp. 2_MG-2023]MDO6596398.1 hypothetical protein [Oceanihabitans sp. 2_MG-2023]
MKKTTLLSIITFLLSVIAFGQNTYVPDDNFEQALIDLGYDSGPLNDYVPTANINTVTILTIPYNSISDLAGIEGFVALQELSCFGNVITSLDITQNTALTILNCYGNNLTNIDLSNNTALTQLYCHSNYLTNLDLSNNTALTYLNSRNNNLTSLDVNNNTALQTLACDNNYLTSLDVSNNTALTDLNCANNILTNLNVKNSNNINFTDFDATNNPSLACVEVDDVTYSTTNWTDIDASSSFSTDCYPFTYIPDDNFEQVLIDLGYDTALDNYVITANINFLTNLNVNNKNIADLTGIEDFVALQDLRCFGNVLTSLDITHNTALTNLRCGSNLLTELDVSQNLLLEDLRCGSNQITQLNIQFNTALTSLVCSSNQLENLNADNGNYINVSTFNATNNPNLICIQVDNASYSSTNWTSIDTQTSFSENCHFNETYVPDDNFEQALINLGYDTVLDNYVLNANINTLTTLNVSYYNISNLTGIKSFSALTELDCTYNDLTSLDLSNCTALKNLYCYENDLTTITTSNCTALKKLHCYNNNLTALDVSNNTALQTLYCYNNDLTSLDISTNTALQYFWCYNNNLTTLDVSNNTAITDFNCSSNNLTSLDVTNNTALVALRCSSNNLTTLDISNNTALIALSCSSNNLTRLHARNGNNLNFTEFFAQNNTSLTCIEVDNAIWSTANWTSIDASSSFSSNCHYDDTYVPDDNFEQALIDLGYDSGVLDDYVSTSIIETITSLNINNKNITDLTGIEDFVVLTNLNCAANTLTNLDLSNNTTLINLFCYNNNLTSINISNNTALTNLRCYNNNLTSIDISNNTALTDLRCYSNNLTNLDVSNNTALTDLNCYSNDLTNIDVSNNTALTDLNCSYNDLHFLDVKNGNNTNITYFNATNNPNLTCIEVDDSIWSTTNWTNIDVATSFSEDCFTSTLYTFIPDNNFEQVLIDLGYDSFLDNYVLTANVETLTNLDVNNKNISDLTGIEDFVVLTDLNCSNNNLTSLDISYNTALTDLSCYDNDLTSLDLSNNTALTYLICSNNDLTSLNVSNNNALINLSCHSNNLTSLDVSNCIALTDLNCYDNNLTSLDVSNCIALTDLDCYDNNLISLDLSNCTILQDLNCYDNNLTSLDVSNCIALTDLNCYNNSLASLNLSNNTALQDLSCYNNSLTSLDLSNNLALQDLSCSGNNLTSLDLSNNTVLQDLICANNYLTSINVKNGNNTNIYNFYTLNNPDLTCIQVDDATYSATYWSDIDAQTSFSEDCNYNTVVLSPKLFLQGAYNNGIMLDDLRSNNYLPTTSPYVDATVCYYCYYGAFDITGNDAIIDWVWIELRDASDVSIVVAQTSALLQADGDVVALDGFTPLTIQAPFGDYYIMLSHRNHLGVLSANTYNLSLTNTSIDFTNNINLITGGTNGIATMNDGKLALYAGDFDGDGQIQNSDKNNVEPLRGTNGYTNADIDMNSEVQNSDIQNKLNPNIGKGEQYTSRVALKLFAKRNKTINK